MRPKQMRSILTFRTTTGAMAMERLCREHDFPGRRIPVPGNISAGCGMCWMAEPEAGDSLYEAARSAGLDVEEYYPQIMV